MTNRIVFLFLLVILAISCNKKSKGDLVPGLENVFSSLKYDKVVAYSYNGEGSIEIIGENGELAKNITKQVELSRSQVQSFTNLLCDDSTYGGDIAACFDPHLGVVFYAENKPTAYVSVCLDCNYLVSSVEIPDAGSGFSDDGVAGIVSFQREVGF
jgi:hypothetical protein